MGAVTLQPAREPVRAPERIGQGWQMQRGSRVLLVEDEPLTAEVFARALTRDGHRVDVACDGLQALRRLHDHPPSILVLDMSLPALPGAEIVRRLRAEGHTQLPIVVVSGSAPAATDLSPAELWPGTWLTKPIKPRELVRIVRQFLGDSE